VHRPGHDAPSWLVSPLATDGADPSATASKGAGRLSPSRIVHASREEVAIGPEERLIVIRPSTGRVVRPLNALRASSRDVARHCVKTSAEPLPTVISASRRGVGARAAGSEGPPVVRREVHQRDLQARRCRRPFATGPGEVGGRRQAAPLRSGTPTRGEQERCAPAYTSDVSVVVERSSSRGSRRRRAWW